MLKCGSLFLEHVETMLLFRLKGKFVLTRAMYNYKLSMRVIQKQLSAVGMGLKHWTFELWSIASVRTYTKNTCVRLQCK